MSQPAAPPVAASAPQKFVIPKLIKRNTLLFALSQSFTGAGMQFAYGFGPLMVMQLTGSASLAGLSVGTVGLSRFFVAYPAGKIADTYGRKPGILFGLVLALIGTVVVGLSMSLASFAVFLAGLLIFSMGMSCAQQLRVAATDMYPPRHRAQALGYVALGSLAGLAISPLVVSVTEPVAYATGLEPLGLPWLMMPLLIIPGMALISLVRPDPKQIGMELGKYYPGYVPPPRDTDSSADFHPISLYRNVRTRLAIVANCAAQGNMSIVMVMTSLVLSHHGYTLTEIAFSHMFHSAGMFAFTIPLGRLADRFGREGVMLPGIAVALFGAGLVAFTELYWSITIGTFLVGIGWAAANVAATALIADHAATGERGRAIGVNESFAGGTAVAMALITGPLIEWYGLPATGLVAVIVAVPPIAMVIAQKIRRIVPA